jgi:hypothetical protein
MNQSSFSYQQTSAQRLLLSVTWNDDILAFGTLRQGAFFQFQAHCPLSGAPMPARPCSKPLSHNRDVGSRTQRVWSA